MKTIRKIILPEAMFGVTKWQVLQPNFKLPEFGTVNTMYHYFIKSKAKRINGLGNYFSAFLRPIKNLTLHFNQDCNIWIIPERLSKYGNSSSLKVSCWRDKLKYEPIKTEIDWLCTIPHPIDKDVIYWQTLCLEMNNNICHLKIQPSDWNYSHTNCLKHLQIKDSSCSHLTLNCPHLKTIKINNHRSAHQFGHSLYLHTPELNTIEVQGDVINFSAFDTKSLINLKSIDVDFFALECFDPAFIKPFMIDFENLSQLVKLNLLDDCLIKISYCPSVRLGVTHEVFSYFEKRIERYIKASPELILKMQKVCKMPQAFPLFLDSFQVKNDKWVFSIGQLKLAICAAIIKKLRKDEFIF